MARAYRVPALDRVEWASDRLVEAERVWRAAIIAARADGASLRDLAEASGTTHTRIRRILDADRLERNPR